MRDPPSRSPEGWGGVSGSGLQNGLDKVRSDKIRSELGKEAVGPRSELLLFHSWI